MHLQSTSTSTDVHVHVSYRHNARHRTPLLIWRRPLIVVSRPGSAAPPPPRRVAVRGRSVAHARRPFHIKLGRARSIVEVLPPCPGNEAALEAKLLGAGRVNSVALWVGCVVLRPISGCSVGRALPVDARSQSEVHGPVIIWGGVEPHKLGCIVAHGFDTAENAGIVFFLVCLFDATYVREKRVMIWQAYIQKYKPCQT